MAKFKISTGDYRLVICGNNDEDAANLAIRLHDRSKSLEKLGDLTLIESLHENGTLTGEYTVMETMKLLIRNTNGIGDSIGQYERNEE